MTIIGIGGHKFHVDFNSMLVTNEAGRVEELILVNDYLHCRLIRSDDKLEPVWGPFHNAYMDYLAEELLKEDT